MERMGKVVKEEIFMVLTLNKTRKCRQKSWEGRSRRDGIDYSRESGDYGVWVGLVYIQV